MKQGDTARVNCPICGAGADQLVKPLADGITIHCPNHGWYDIGGSVSSDSLKRFEKLPSDERQAIFEKAQETAEAESRERPVITTYLLGE